MQIHPYHYLDIQILAVGMDWERGYSIVTYPFYNTLYISLSSGGMSNEFSSEIAIQMSAQRDTKILGNYCTFCIRHLNIQSLRYSDTMHRMAFLFLIVRRPQVTTMIFSPSSSRPAIPHGATPACDQLLEVSWSAAEAHNGGAE